MGNRISGGCKFGLSACAVVSFVHIVGIGRSACAVVSFHLFLGSAPRVGRPSRNLAKKCKVRVASLPRLNSVPRIPAVKATGAGRSRIRRFGPNRHPFFIRPPKGWPHYVDSVVPFSRMVEINGNPPRLATDEIFVEEMAVAPNFPGNIGQYDPACWFFPICTILRFRRPEQPMPVRVDTPQIEVYDHFRQ